MWPCLAFGVFALWMELRVATAWGLVSAAMTGALALLAAGSSFRAAGRTVGTERLVWRFLVLGAGLAAAGEFCYLWGRWQGWNLEAAPPLVFAGWATLYYFVFVGFYLAAHCLPHRDPGRPVRPALVLDALLVALVLLGIHLYLLVAYRISSGSLDRRLSGVLLALLLGLGAAVRLAWGRRQTGSRRWKRIYGLLGAAVLCQVASEAIWLLLRDPRGEVARPLAPYMALAGLLAMTAYSLLAAAGKVASREGRVEAPSGEPAAAPGWRDLAAPSLTLLALFGVPLLDGLLSTPASLPGEGWRLRNAVVSGLLGAYVVLVLFRQLLVQIENRALERNLQQESWRLRLLVESIHDAVVTEDLRGRIVFVNDRFLDLFGVSRAEALASRLEDYMHPEDRPLDGDRRPEPVESWENRCEFRGLRRDGRPLYLESSLAAVRPSGLILGYQSVIRDITARRQAEREQRELGQRLEFLVRHMPLGYIVLDLGFRIRQWNQNASRIFGWSAVEAFGRDALELLFPAETREAAAEAWAQARRGQQSGPRLHPSRTRDGRRIECEWFHTGLIDPSGEVAAMASLVQDVTEQRTLEAQLRQSQKMEAVGVLAGGIAHDFNNLLTPILGNVSLALMALGRDHAAARGLLAAERAAERAAELVRQLLGFSRKGVSLPRPISLNVCLEETAALLARTVDPRVRLETRQQPDLWLVDADLGQMLQVLMNLCVNACDAMENGGQVILSTTNRALDAEAARGSAPEARPGEYVELAVSDTGAGMDSATLARIFEPFFTTKEVGKGTGLGLAMVYGIVKQHEGWITVDSRPGGGSTFTVFLPRSHQEKPLPHGRGSEGYAGSLLEPIK